ncbi:hypothetical protein B7982_02045 [Fibrobacter sp. UWB2]|uniref:hypothetical protein n=1 Tax=Fibrobacter sp. UWB2 TaxID=1964358 RepID=UPI000B520F9F|nr:hypothetical protein [Fibrobacter sp. UWB2]OWV24517.1 hypothetical protein B7982_02045 [Fibrobacter sp. UWB2]
MFRVFGLVLLLAAFTFAQDESVSDYDRWMQAKAHRDSVRNAERIQKNSVPFDFLVGMTINMGFKVINNETQLNHYEKIERIVFFEGTFFQAGASVQWPLLQYHLAVRLGVLFEYAPLFLSEPLYIEDGNGEDKRVTGGGLSQGRIAFPILFAVKPRSSFVSFEFGPQISIPLFDNLELDGARDRELDSSMEFSVLLGVGFRVNERIYLDLLLDAKFYHKFNDHFADGLADWSSVAIKAGVTFNPL